MLLEIIKHEWLLAWRERQLAALWLIVGILLLFATFSGWQTYARIQAERQASNQLMRAAWENQGDQNPHSSAHYGTYVYKPISILHFLEPGIEKFAGVSLRLEGHVQHGAAFAAAAEQSSLSRFGDFNTSLILQVIVPLLLLFIAFNSLLRERTSGSLRVLLAQGLSPQTLLLGKVLAIWGMAMSLLVLVGVVSSFLIWSQPQLGMDKDEWWRFLGLSSLYSAYYFFISALAVQIAAAIRMPALSLLSLLGFWVLSTVILPKVFAAGAERQLPLQGVMAFNQAMREEREQGLNGHDPEDERTKRFERKILAKYQASQLSDLPINYDGLLMQEDEYYGNAVWDKHFGLLYRDMQAQLQFTAMSSWLNPFQALRNLSLAMANSDLHQHLHFQKSAEHYRRTLIRTLNEKMAYGGSKTGDWDWQVSESWFATLPDFQYQAPPFNQSLAQRTIELTALGTWLLAAILSIFLPWWKPEQLL